MLNIIVTNIGNFLYLENNGNWNDGHIAKIKWHTPYKYIDDKTWMACASSTKVNIFKVVSKQDYNKLTATWLNFKINIHSYSD